MRDFVSEINYLYEEFKRANKINEENLIKILSDNSLTNYGKKYDFKNITSIKEYQERVPLSDYRDYINGNEYVYEVGYHLATSGTLGNRKKYTVSKESMNRSAGYNYIMPFYLLNMGTEHGLNISLFRDPSKETLLSCALYDHLYQNGYFKLDDWVDKDFLFGQTNQFIPYIKLYIALAHKEITYIDSIFIYDTLVVFNYLVDNYKLLLNDIINHTISVDLSTEDKEKLLKVKYSKERIEELKDILDGNFNKPVALLLFPNLKFVSGVGGGKYAIYDEALRKFIGNTPIYYYIFAQTEATMGVPLKMNEPVYALMPRTCFYEFRDILTDKILLANELVIGNKYEIIATTFSGIYRYHTGDKVCLVGYQDETPLVRIEGRIGSIINIAGEKVDDADITLTFEKMSKDYNIGLFSVGIDRSVIPNRYALFVESNDNLSDIAKSFDKILMEISFDYYDLRGLNSINPPIAIKTKKERFISIQKGQIKPKVILPDEIAKEWKDEK